MKITNLQEEENRIQLKRFDKSELSSIEIDGQSVVIYLKDNTKLLIEAWDERSGLNITLIEEAQ